MGPTAAAVLHEDTELGATAGGEADPWRRQGIMGLNDLLHDADDLAASEGDPRVLDVAAAAATLSESYGMDEDMVAQLLRYNAVPTYVAEGGGISARQDMDETSAGSKRWRGYWPHAPSKTGQEENG